MATAQNLNAIDVSHVSKHFHYWNDRPNSLKSKLIALMRGGSLIAKPERFQALEDVSLTIHKGEFVGIMGRNGSGKSTLLKLIAGIYAPNQGTIAVQGRIAPLIELGAGFHPELSGYENIFLMASILGLGRKATNEVLAEILAFADIGDLVHMPIRKFSTGMLVRLGFAIATHTGADTLLVDEVLAVGDMAFQERCLKRIHTLRERGCTVVLVTHDPAAVEKHCERAIVIDRKKVIFDGDTRTAVASYQRVIHESAHA
jgi:ABC-type polysaccharide/polyol phosphate transport system ATPase subunit